MNNSTLTDSSLYKVTQWLKCKLCEFRKDRAAVVSFVMTICLFFAGSTSYAQVDPNTSRIPLPGGVDNLYDSIPYESLSDDFNGPDVDLGPTGWAYRERSTNKNWATDSSGVYIENNSYLVLKGDISTSTGSGLVSKDTSQYAFYVTRWQVAGQIQDDSPSDWHPAIWAAKCDFSSEFNCINTGDQRLEIDFMEGFQSSSAANWHNKIITWNGPNLQTHDFTPKITDWPTQTESQWATIGLEYTPNYLRFWKYENDSWISVKTMTWTSGNTVRGVELNDGYRKPVYWILSNLYWGTSAPNQDSYLHIDYFYTFKYNGGESNVDDFNNKSFRLGNADFNNFLRGYDPTQANTNGDHSNVTQEDLNTTNPDQQTWEFTTVPTQVGLYFIDNAFSNRRLRAFDANNNPTSGDDVPVTVFTKNSWGSMMWKPIPIPGDSMSFFLKSYNGFFLKGASSNNSYATLELDSTTAGTKWKLYDITGPLPDTTTSVSAVITPSMDAYVKGGTSADSNFGSATTLVVKESSNATFDRMSFLNFDLSGISGDVASAKIRLKVSTEDAGASHSLHLVTDDSWTETGITWNNKPSVSSLISTQTVPSAAAWIEFDVTYLVNNETDDILSVRISDANAAEHFVQYHSSEATNSEDRPQLVYETGAIPEPLVPTKDTFGKGGTSASNNYGTQTTIEVKESGNANYDRKAYLQFDISNITETVTDAKLRLQVETRDASTSHDLYLVTDDSWTETGLTWTNQPAGSSLIGTQAVPSVGSWIEFDVTSILNSEADTLLSLQLFNPSQNEAFVRYHSSEATNADDRPQLVYMVNTTGARLQSETPLNSQDIESLEEDVFTVYPNPASDQINIVGSDLQGATVELIDLSGKSVLQEKLTHDTSSVLNLNKVQKGLYFLKVIKHQGEPITIKIIVE